MKLTYNLYLYLYSKDSNLYKKLAKLVYRLAIYLFPIMLTIFPSFKSGVVKEKRNQKIIVSLTTFPARINKVHLVIETLLRQSMKPDMIILWLANTQFESADIPKKLMKMQERGLKIRFCDDDLRSHKKYYYAFKEFPEDLIITVDDDMYYPFDTIKLLYDSHKKYPNCVIGFRGFNLLEQSKDIHGDNNQKNYQIEIPSAGLMLTGGSGILYPPHCMYEDIFDKDKIKRLSFSADDIYLKFMEYLKGTLAVIPIKRDSYIVINDTQDEALYRINTGENNENNKCFERLKAYYQIN